MKTRKTLKVLLAGALLVSAVGLASCGDETPTTTPTVAPTVQPTVQPTVVPTTPSVDLSSLILTQDGAVANADFSLPTVFYGKTITWTSSNASVLTVTDSGIAVIYRPAQAETITLTANVEGSKKDFTIYVNPVDAQEIADNYTFAYSKKILNSGEYALESEYAYELKNTISNDTAYDTKTASITYEITNGAEYASIVENKLVIAATKDKQAVKVRATFTYGEEIAVKIYSLSTLDEEKKVAAEQIVVNVPYKMGLTQETLGTDLYFTGSMSGYYAATTEDINAGVAVYFEENGEGYSMYFYDASNVKKYITVVQSGTHNNFTIATAASTVWTWDAEYDTVVTELNGTKLFLGTYSSYNTISASKYSYIPENFPCHFYIIKDVQTELKEKTAYSLMLTQETLGQNLYFAGDMSGYYAATTQDATQAAAVYVASVEGGYNIYFYQSGTKKFINVVQSGTHFNFKIEDAASSVWTWDATYNTLITTCGDTQFFLGTYSSYNTISPSKYSYIAENFVCHFYINYNEQPKIEDNTGNNQGGSGDNQGGTGEDTTTVSKVTIAEALTIAAGKAHNEYTTELYEVTGTIKDINDPVKGNITITDGTNDILIYGLYSEDGSIGYASMTEKPFLGDVITVKSVVGQFANVAQLKDAKLIANEPKVWTDAEKVAYDKENSGIKFSSKYIAANTLDLVVEGAKFGTTITWAVTAGTTATVSEGKLVLAPTETEDSVTLTATFVNGGVTDTVTYTFKTQLPGADTVMADEKLAVAANKGTMVGTTTITWAATNFTFKNDQAGSTNAIRTTDTDHYRCYAGSVVTITAAEGVLMTKLVITVTESKYVTVLQSTLQAAGLTGTASGNVITVELANAASEIVLTSSAQWRLKDITVSYIK